MQKTRGYSMNPPQVFGWVRAKNSGYADPWRFGLAGSVVGEWSS
jgi:hypothetical protein